jgi:hypothetical protein
MPPNLDFTTAAGVPLVHGVSRMVQAAA